MLLKVIIPTVPEDVPGAGYIPNKTLIISDIESVRFHPLTEVNEGFLYSVSLPHEEDESPQHPMFDRSVFLPLDTPVINACSELLMDEVNESLHEYFEQFDRVKPRDEEDHHFVALLEITCTDGRVKGVYFDTEAYLCNDNGKTIEHYETEYAKSQENFASLQNEMRKKANSSAKPAASTLSKIREKKTEKKENPTGPSA